MGVREGLLDYTVRGKRNCRRDALACAGGVPLDLEAGAGVAGDQPVELVERGERVCRYRRVVRSAHHAQDAAELVKHALGAAADMCERFLCAGGVVAYEVGSDTRLYIDHGDVVGDHIVQFASDPQAFFYHLAVRFFLEPSFGAFPQRHGPFMPCDQIGPPAVHRVAGRGSDRNPSYLLQFLAIEPWTGVRDRRRQEQHPGGHCPGGPSHPAAGSRRHGVQGKAGCNPQHDLIIIRNKRPDAGDQCDNQHRERCTAAQQDQPGRNGTSHEVDGVEGGADLTPVGRFEG